jgi:hypothetical protein
MAVEAAGLSIRGGLEPRVSEEVVDLVAEPLRDAFREACLGLPYALIWITEKSLRPAGGVRPAGS